MSAGLRGLFYKLGVIALLGVGNSVYYWSDHNAWSVLISVPCGFVGGVMLGKMHAPSEQSRSITRTVEVHQLPGESTEVFARRVLDECRRVDVWTKR